MGTCSDFLEMLQLVITARHCMGQDCPNTSPAAQRLARDVDASIAKMPQQCRTEGHRTASCADCAVVSDWVMALLATLDTDGVALPPDQRLELLATPNRS